MTDTDQVAAGGNQTMDCGAAVRMLWDYLDGNLGPREIEAIQTHVNRCSHCFTHADFGQVVLDAIAQVRKSQEADAATALRERVVARLRDHGYREP